MEKRQVNYVCTCQDKRVEATPVWGWQNAAGEHGPEPALISTVVTIKQVPADLSAPMKKERRLRCPLTVQVPFQLDSAFRSCCS